MYYGFNFRTPNGTMYPFTNESNAAKYPPIPRGLFYAFSNPALSTLQSKNALIVYPFATMAAPGVTESDLASYAGTFLGLQQDGVPVYLGPPVANLWGQKTATAYDLREFPDAPAELKALFVQPTLGWPLLIGVIILAVIFYLAIREWSAVQLANAATQQERERTKQHELDTALQSQKIIKEEFSQVCSTGACDFANGGPGCDVQRVFWANGAKWEFALTQCGAGFLGGSSKQLDKGFDMNDLARQLTEQSQAQQPGGDIGAWLIPAALIVGAAAVGYAAVKAIGARKERTPERKEASA